MEQNRMAVQIWKTGTRRGIVYVEGKERAERVIAAARRAEQTFASLPTEKILPGSMAVYSDKKGRPFAWQITFDIKCWSDVIAAAGGGEA